MCIGSWFLSFAAVLLKLISYKSKLLKHFQTVLDNLWSLFYRVSSSNRRSVYWMSRMSRSLAQVHSLGSSKLDALINHLYRKWFTAHETVSEVAHLTTIQSCWNSTRWAATFAGIIRCSDLELKIKTKPVLQRISSWTHKRAHLQTRNF